MTLNPSEAAEIAEFVKPYAQPQEPTWWAILINTGWAAPDKNVLAALIGRFGDQSVAIFLAESIQDTQRELDEARDALQRFCEEHGIEAEAA